MTAEEADELRRTVDSSGAERLDGNEEEQDTPDHNIGNLDGQGHVHQNSGHHLDGDLSNEY
jgi:hypothetical protein